jgi:hypothetical protein
VCVCVCVCVRARARACVRVCGERGDSSWGNFVCNASIEVGVDSKPSDEQEVG